MTKFTQEDLAIATTRTDGTHLSLFMPTTRLALEAPQTSIRWKNLLARVEAAVDENGALSDDLDALLEPARGLLSDGPFWEQPGDGLALFTRPGWARSFRTSFPLPAMATVGDRFMVAPLLEALSARGRFLLLSLNRQQARLFEGSRFGLEQASVELPAKQVAARQTRDRPDAFLAGWGRSRAGVVFNARGNVEQRLREQTLQYFRAVDAAVRRYARNSRPPLLLAGVSDLLPLYRRASTYSNIVRGGLPSNAEPIPRELLHGRGWNIIEPLVRRDEDVALARYLRLLGTGLTVSGPTAVLDAAAAGRVDTLLLVATAITPTGPSDMPVLRLGTGAPTLPEQLNDVAFACLAHGGVVHTVAAERLPHATSVAALLRF